MTDAPASSVMFAELVPTRRPKVLVFLRWLPSFLGAFLFGSSGEWRGTDIVVREIVTGREALRIDAMDAGEADRLLALLREDLDAHTVEGFLDEWRARAGQ